MEYGDIIEELFLILNDVGIWLRHDAVAGLSSDQGPLPN
jgi:hypothetical protein